MAAKKGGLGKGLDAIFSENDMEDSNTAVAIRIDELEPNRAQPRKSFDDESIAELADSISRHGVLQPLLVRPLIGGGYQIVAGERRWRAARMAGVKEVPAVVRDLSESEVMQLALIENLQREDLNPLEEAGGYQALIEEYGFTQEDVARTVGRSRPAVANALRLLALPEDLRELVSEGVLSAGHARTLLAFPDEESMRRAAKLAVEQELSVRQLEKLAQSAKEQLEEQEEKRESPKRRIPYFDEVELALNEHLGRRVAVKGNKKKGTLQIEFYGEDDLAELLKLFGDR